MTSSISDPCRRILKQVIWLWAGASLGWGVVACDRITVSQYEAIATTAYTWQVDYLRSADRPQDRRQETFASTSLVNRNGERPESAVTGPDERGLWWPDLPPRPTVDEMESRRQGTQEQISSPQLIKDVDYTLIYQDEGETVSLPTDYAVYREAIKALRTGQSLDVLLGVNNSRVEDVEPVN